MGSGGRVGGVDRLGGTVPLGLLGVDIDVKPEFRC